MAWPKPNDKEVPIILGVGRLTMEKNFDLLIEAFAAVRSRQACRLIILSEIRPAH
jgi:glycosyltransferase involved in cell wall biosynthesis